MQGYLTKRKHFDNRLEALKAKRSILEPEWKDIVQYLAPDCGSFDDPTSDKQKKKDPYYKQNINSLPAFYMKNLAAALVSNLTPGRLRWFRLNVDNESREESIWLNEVSRIMYNLFNNASLYEHLYNAFLESSLFGPSIIGMQYTPELVYDFVPATIGEFYLAEGKTGIVDTCYRRFAMTNIQLYDAFGDKVGKKILDALERDDTETYHNVVHAVEPNPRYLKYWKNEFNKPYISVYYIEDERNDEEFLEYKGLSHFPYLIARWDKVGDSTYGNGIGRLILGDVKSLQAYERDLAKASKKKISPPLKGSQELKNAITNVSADGITFTNDINGLTPLYNVNYETNDALNNLQRIMQRLYSQTYNDLFYALLNKDKTMSATEAGAIEQEKLTMLGSVTERLQNEFLKPLIVGGFMIAYENNVLPEPPQSIVGKELTIRYQSLLAMAQELGDLSNVERYLQFITSAGSINPTALKKPDMLAISNFYAERLGLDLSLTKSDEQVEAELQAEQAAQQEMQQQQLGLEQLTAGAQAAKDYAQAGTVSGNALDELMQ